MRVTYTAIKCFQFPFYLHSEGYEDELDSVLESRDEFDTQTAIGRKCS